MEWISVKDKLPNPHKQKVLVALSDGTVTTATDWIDWPDGTVSFEIIPKESWKQATHWMPLPVPPNTYDNFFRKIEEEDDGYPCYGHDCYDKGNYHMSCIGCPLHKTI